MIYSTKIRTLSYRRLSLLLVSSLMLAGCDKSSKNSVPNEVLVAANASAVNGLSTDTGSSTDSGTSTGNGNDPMSSFYDDDFVVIKPFIPDDQKQPLTIDSATPFRIASAYSDVLKPCYQAESESLCNFGVLPLIGKKTQEPDINAIMDRVVVTHDWMGTRFEQVLSSFSTDELGLFKGVAIIYIGSSINGMKYTGNKAALEIGPSMLWLTADEKAAIRVSTSASRNTSFNSRDELKFTFVTRHLSNNVKLDENSDQSEREFAAMFFDFSRQLYKRLALAIDAIDPATFSNELSENTPRDQLRLSPGLFAQQLHDDVALTNTNSALYELVKVYYNNEPATDAQKTETAADVGSQFSNEGKMNFFSYTTPLSDAQQLFSSGMLLYKHGITTDSLFLEGRGDINASIISFGERNRLASPLVAPRAKFVMQAILGSSSELDQFFESSMGESILIEPGTLWRDYASTTDSTNTP